MKRFWGLIVPLAVLAISLSSPAAPPAAAAHGSLIAYVSPSRNNQQIRTIDPLSGVDRLVWSVPDGTSRDNGIGRLSWRPDGAEIAFDSGHDWQRSMLLRDLYAVQPSGLGLRRITAPPGPLNTAAMPSGTVTLRVENYGGGKDLMVYLDGAPEPVSFSAPTGSAWDITFYNVPDFGPGVRQYARVFNQSQTPLGYQCWFDPAAFADVQPGQVATAGTLTALQETNCPLAFGSSWNADGSGLDYLLRDSRFGLIVPTNIWQIGASPPPTTLGELALDMGQYGTLDKLYMLARGPAPTRQDDLLFVQDGTLVSPIYLGAVDDLGAARYVDTGTCARAACEVTGLAWLPDGSGFVFSRSERGPSISDPQPEGAALYIYSFETQTTTQILRLPGEVIGQVTVAPDGTMIAFERSGEQDDSVATVTFGPRPLCPCSVWLVGSDGAGLQQLVADGRAPAWSQAVPPAAVPSVVWLPLLSR